MERLIIIRHGHRDDNINKIYGKSKNNNCPLSEIGKKELKLKMMTFFENNDFKIDKIYTSPFLRTIQTSEIVLSTYNSKYNLNLEMEINYLISEGQHFDVVNFEKKLENKLKENDIEYPESKEHLLQRIKLFCENIKKLKYKNICVVSHGVICGYILKYFINNVDFKDNPNDKVKFKYADKIVLKKQQNNWYVEYSDVTFHKVNDILKFWFPDNKYHKFWFDKSKDDFIINNFKILLEQVKNNQVNWKPSFESNIAKIIILDQFSRNIYRNNKEKIKVYDKIANLIAMETIYKYPNELKQNLNYYVFCLMVYRHQNTNESIKYVINKLEEIDLTTLSDEDLFLFNKFYKTSKRCFIKLNEDNHK